MILKCILRESVLKKPDKISNNPFRQKKSPIIDKFRLTILTLIYNNVIIYLIIQRILHVFMDVIPSEIFRGHLDTIILLSLVNEDKHTNQIRDEIEERSDGKFELKQGTFYSCLQRIVKQGFVTEYRATSADDGVRRKFYQLTEKGKSYIDDNKDKWELSRSVVNILLETPEKKQEPPKKQLPVKEQKPTAVSEAFDIDKALKDYLNSPDTTVSKEKSQKIIEDVQEEPLVGVSNENVKIIDFSDIATHEKTKKEPVKAEQLTFDTAVADSYKHEEKASYKENYTQKQSISPELATSPETFDLINLVGMTKEELEAAKSVDKQKQLENERKEPEVTKASQQEPIKEEVQKKEVIIEVVEEPKERNRSQFPDPSKTAVPSYSPTIYEDEDDYYNGETTVTHDYKAVLQRIFPQQTKKSKKAEEPREMVYVQGTDINSYFGDVQVEEPKREKTVQQAPKTPTEKVQKKQQVNSEVRPKTQEPEVPVVKSSDGYDFSDIQSLAKIEGFKVNIASGATKTKVNSILINKLVAVSSLVFFLFALAEIAVLAYFTAKSAGLTFTPFWITAAVFALFPLISLIIYFIDPKRKVGSIPTMKSVIELCIVIMLNLVLIMIVFAILAEVDFASTSQLLKYVLYPSVLILNIPIYFIIKYLNLENPRFYN